MITTKNSVLIVIDVQGNLAYRMHDKEALFKNIRSIIKACKTLSIPIIYTEQAPEKIGSTVPEIVEFLTDVPLIKKRSFSCCAEKDFPNALKILKRSHVIVVGIETHVCLYQTVRDLLDKKYQVQVVADAVSSRTLENKEIALKRMGSIGAVLTSTEMLATELLITSAHEKFKDVLNLIR